MDATQQALLQQGCTGSCDAAAVATAITQVAAASAVVMGSFGVSSAGGAPVVVSHPFVLTHPDKVCGDGRIEALSPSHIGTCPNIGSQTSNVGTVTPEGCDTSSDAGFGIFSAGCGENSANCALTKNQVVELTEAATEAKRSTQLQYGVLTAAMSNYDYNPFDSNSAKPKLNPCLYSTQLVDANGADTTDMSVAAGCKITADDRTKYTSLQNCYDSTSVTAGSSSAELDQFGKRLDANSNDFLLNGHKCQYPANIKIQSAVGGQMTWTETPRDMSTNKIVAPFDGLYDVCFSINDPSWPAVHPSSNEFIQQVTRLQYEVVCDPLDQEAAYPDEASDCETNTASGTTGSFRDEAEQQSHRCSRLGQRKNPCSNVHRLWELYSCSDTECESLEGLASDYSDRYGATTEQGVKYTFEHDSAASKNRFGCNSHQFDNVRLASAGMMLGDATEAQSRYICATGGQDSECDPGMGEIVHNIDTCSSSDQFHDIEALKAKLDPAKWKDLSTLYNQIFTDASDVSTATAGSNPAVDCSATPDDVDCEVFRFYRSIQQYKAGCGRKLKIKMAKGVSGQMTLRVVVRNYNTAVHDADPTRGYTYWTAAMVPVAIEAKVKSLSASDNTERDSSALTSVDEKGTLDFMSLSQTGSPFSAMETSQYDHTDESVRISKFSRSTRTHLEVIECTASNQKLAVESNEEVPRFRLSADAAFAAKSFGGNFEYFGSYQGDGASPTNRIYELSTEHSYEAPTIDQLQRMVPALTLRAKGDLSSNGDWWAEIQHQSSLANIDSYHEGYSTQAGICLINRLYVFEPSSCNYEVIDSQPYYVAAKPVNSDATPSVSFNPTSKIWEEDQTVKLKIDVQHAGSDDDSKLWYFSHVEIEDLNAGAMDAQNGAGFELFSYGSTVGDSAAGASDGVTNKIGITKGADGKWRSFSNVCSRWIYEEGLQSGVAADQGGFSSPNLVTGSFASAEACLNDARRQGEDIWGGDLGVHLRPFRKMTKNLDLRITVFMYDGDAFGWHSADSTLEQTASSTVQLLHIPRVTRYDQQEITQPDHTLDENGNVVLNFSPAADRTEGVGLPLAYRAGTKLCTYTKKGADGSVSGVDEYDVTKADHDKACSDATDCADETGLRKTCELSGADGGRATIETVVLFDESEASHNSGDVYLDGSDAWLDGAMVMPEQIDYQPAGNNPRASDENQWYRIESCDGDSNVDNVFWCDDTSDTGRDTKAGTTDSYCCDIAAKGQADDAIAGPGASTSALLNSLSVDKSDMSILSTGVHGFSENFWIVKRASAATVDFLPKNSLCIKGRSDFNTEDSTWPGATESPVNLRLIVVALDSVTAAAAVDATTPTWSARSKSNTNQGKFSIAIDSIRQPVVPSVATTHMWTDTYPIDGANHPVSFIEERNDPTRAQVPTQLDWSGIEALVPGSLATNVDCGGGNSSDTFCADRVRFTEQNDFHDQHIGRVEIKGFFQKTCGASKMGSDQWKPAGGLFDVYVSYVDDYVDFGDALPGNSFALYDGAGYKVSDSWEVDCDPTDPACAKTILNQAFSTADHGTEIVAGQPGGSICRIVLDDGLDAAATASIRSTACHIRDAYDVTGHNTFTWSDTILNRVVANKCHKPVGGAGTFDCPAGAFSAREIASNLRFRLPHKWSNCVRMKFEITISNDDRVKPSYMFESGTGAGLVDYKSGPATVYVQPQERAEEPVMWVATSLADESGCLGSSQGGVGETCEGKTGTQAIGEISGGTYDEIDSNTNLDGVGAMTSITMVAGYRSQIRVLAASGATDVEAEAANPVHPLTTSTDYAWDSLRALHQVSGEHVHLTIESKYDAMVPGEQPQRFCVWMCPESTPEGSGCNKNALVRVKPLPEAGEDFTSEDVNCKPCSGTAADGCYEWGLNADGSAKKCEDIYARDSTLVGCPTYSVATPYHNPSTRYSIKCTKAGSCAEWRNIYISYPADQVTDDVLELTSWSRSDWQGSAGYQKSRVSVNIKMKPSITLSEVGFGIESIQNCDPDAPGLCATGFYGSPLQANQAVTVVPSVDPPITIALLETKLHGINGASSVSTCASLIAVDDLATKGSSHDVTTECGIRFPVNFLDNTLMAVAPIGVKFKIQAVQNIEAKFLAQALQMLCSSYTRDSTGAAANECIGEFTAINPASPGAEETSLLRFQSADAAQQPDATTRLIDWADFAASGKPASHLSWNVGEQMNKKEMVLFGRSDAEYSLSDYSFENHACEATRTFTVELTHQVGYSPAVVAETRSAISVNVEDDDFYGKVQMAGVSGSKLYPLEELDASFRTESMAKIDWNADGTANDEAFNVYVMRSRRSSESNTAAKRAIDMKPLRAWIKVDLGTLNTNEFKVRISNVHGEPDTIVNTVTYEMTAAEVLAGDGVTPNMVYVDFPAASNDVTHDCNKCNDPNESCYFYKCDGTVGAADRDVPFQFFVISFEAVGPASGCNEGGDKQLSFNVEKVVYTAAAGTTLDGNLISCGTDLQRNPLQDSEKAIVFNQILTTLAEDPQTKAPFRVDFAGFSPVLEGAKESPIAWNAGQDGSFVPLTETEHSDCSKNGAGFVCSPRKFRMHICTTLRDTEQNTVWGSWSADTFRFFTDLTDSADSWSQIGDYYDLSCPSNAELVQMSNDASGASIECTKMSSKMMSTATLQVSVYCEETHAEYLALTTQQKYDYCGDHVPKKLMWRVSTDANGGRDAFSCPTSANAADTGASDPFTKLPYVEFTNKDDSGVVNLSRRPKLCVDNGGLPMHLVVGANTDTCSSVGAQNCIDLRIQDDELFAKDNSLLDRDISTFDADFSQPIWDSVNGKLKIDVTNRYYADPQEKTLVNVGVGQCEPETGVSVRSFWEQYEDSTVSNPITTGTTAFGSCDFLTHASFPASQSNAQMFQALFGESSAQPTSDQIAALAAADKMFGFDGTDVTGTNTLFTTPRDLGPGGEWTVSSEAIDSHNNADLDTNGFKAQLSVSLERLQACVDRTGAKVVEIKAVNGNTVYEFTLSSTHVTAMRKGDASYVHYSPKCTERKYTLSVSNSMFALSGAATNSESNAIYVDKVQYKATPEGVCQSESDCVNGLGPNHPCPASDTFNSNTLKSLEYTVNLDMRTVTNNVAGSSVTSFYGIASTSEVAPMPTNCYGSSIQSVDTASASGTYVEAGVTRTILTFRTACLELRPFASGAYGLPVADVFATCASDLSKSTDFAFKTRIWECTSQVGLLNPTAANSGCQLLPDWLNIQIAIAYTESPISVSYEVEFESKMSLYRSHDHRLPDGTFPVKAARDAWRTANVLQATAADPYVTFPIESMLTASLGFVAGSALEAVMTTAIRSVRLCRFKEFCYLPGISTNSAGAPLCSWDNVVLSATHSPYANHARNPTLDGGKGCSEVGATASCDVTVKQTATAIPRLTCARERWEEFAVAEAVATMGSSSYQSAFTDNLVDGTNKVLNIGILAAAFDPTLEGMLLIDHGTTTTLAASIYGSCEDNQEAVGSETITDSVGSYGDIVLNHIMPKAPASGSTGVCTCKGQRAHAFTDDGGSTHPYRTRSSRKVVYDTEYYNNDPTDAASLHKCTWLNTPQHSVSETPLNSVDQFTMSLEMLTRGKEYFFELNAVQFDHQAFTAQDLNDPLSDQFALGETAARRLLSNEDQHPDHAHTLVTPMDMPRAAIQKLARRQQETQTNSAGRKTLSLMVPVSDVQTTTAVFPQGPVKLQSSDQSGSFESGSTSGFIIEDGPQQQHDLYAQVGNRKEWVQANIYDIRNGTNNTLENREWTFDNHMDWIEHGSFETQWISESLQIIFSESVWRSSSWFIPNMFTESLDCDAVEGCNEHQLAFRASVGIVLWTILFLLLIEMILKTVAKRNNLWNKPNNDKEMHYSFTFFAFNSIIIGKGTEKGSGLRFFASIMLMLLNEFSLIVSGAYFWVLLLYPLHLIVFIIMMIDSCITGTKMTVTKTFAQYFGLMMFYVHDFSCYEYFTSFLGNSEKDNCGHRCKMLLFVIPTMVVRFFQYSLAFVLLPTSIYYYAIAKIALAICYLLKGAFGEMGKYVTVFIWHLGNIKNDNNPYPYRNGYKVLGYTLTGSGKSATECVMEEGILIPGLSESRAFKPLATSQSRYAERSARKATIAQEEEETGLIEGKRNKFADNLT
jgi:hypothetical protein